MDYRLIVFLTNRAIKVVELFSEGNNETIQLGGQETFYYNRLEEIQEFKEVFCRAFNVSNIKEMDAAGIIISCGAEVEKSIALQTALKELRQLDAVDIRRLLPMVLQNKGLFAPNKQVVLSLMETYFLVKIDDKGVAETLRSKASRTTIALGGEDFSFLYFFKWQESVLSEEERWKHQQELAKVQREAEKLIVEAQEQAQQEINTMQHEYATMIADYERCKKIVEDLEAEKRRKKEKFASLGIGDTVKFGKYYQDNIDIKQDIEWLVLDVKEKKVLLISRRGLDAVQFHPNLDTHQWSKCNLRSWLNRYFLKTVFSEDEQNQLASTNVEKGVSDKLFLLSYDELKVYSTKVDVRKCKATDFAKYNGADTDNGYCSWWLRTYGYSTVTSLAVNRDGSIDKIGFIVSYSSNCVRPAMWVNL